jgi:hypothetical protein
MPQLLDRDRLRLFATPMGSNIPGKYHYSCPGNCHPSVERQLFFPPVLPQQEMLPEKAMCPIGLATGNVQSSAARLNIPCGGVSGMGALRLEDI